MESIPIIERQYLSHRSKRQRKNKKFCKKITNVKAISRFCCSNPYSYCRQRIQEHNLPRGRSTNMRPTLQWYATHRYLCTIQWTVQMWGLSMYFVIFVSRSVFFSQNTKVRCMNALAVCHFRIQIITIQRTAPTRPCWATSRPTWWGRRIFSSTSNRFPRPHRLRWEFIKKKQEKKKKQQTAKKSGK